MFLIYFVNYFFFFVCIFVEYLSFKMINVMYTYINIFVIDVIHLEYLYSMLMCIYFKSYWCVKECIHGHQKCVSFAFYLNLGLGFLSVSSGGFSSGFILYRTVQAQPGPASRQQASVLILSCSVI